MDRPILHPFVGELAPTLVRWSPPPGAPPHLSVGLARLEAARRGLYDFELYARLASYIADEPERVAFLNSAKVRSNRP